MRHKHIRQGLHAHLHVIATLAAASSAFVAVPALAEDNGQTARRACFETVHRYSVLRDHGPVDDYGDLFTEDAEFTIGGNTVKGRENLKSRLVEQLSAGRAMHTMTTVNIADDAKTGLSYMTVVVGDSETQTQTDAFYVEVYDEYAFEGMRCLIAKRDVEFVFTKAAE